jgi:hypothetical protein
MLILFFSGLEISFQVEEKTSTTIYMLHVIPRRVAHRTDPTSQLFSVMGG